jgi:hypothetical protein
MAYMEEEHPGMEEELRAAEGEVARRPRLDHIAPPPTRTQSIVGATLGFLALAVGAFCIGMIVWAVAFC